MAKAKYENEMSGTAAEPDGCEVKLRKFLSSCNERDAQRWLTQIDLVGTTNQLSTFISVTSACVGWNRVRMAYIKPSSGMRTEKATQLSEQFYHTRKGRSMMQEASRCDQIAYRAAQAMHPTCHSRGTDHTRHNHTPALEFMNSSISII